MTVSGDLTAADTRRLATMLSAMAWANRERATLNLNNISAVGSDLLRVLRTAWTRAHGALTVTTEQPEARFTLALVGVGEMTWPEHRDRDERQSEVNRDDPVRA